MYREKNGKVRGKKDERCRGEWRIIGKMRIIKNIVTKKRKKKMNGKK